MKKISLGGPSTALHRLIWRCKVLSCPSSNLPGFLRCRSSNRVLASSPGLISNIDFMLPHTSSKGSLRVRHVCSCLSSLGNLLCLRYLRAVFSSIPAFIAATPKFFSVCINLNNLLTCWSVTIQITPFVRFGCSYHFFGSYVSETLFVYRREL